MKYLTAYLMNGYSFPFVMDGPDWREEARWHAQHVAEHEGTEVTAVYYYDPSSDMMTQMYEWAGTGQKARFLESTAFLPARRLRVS